MRAVRRHLVAGLLAAFVVSGCAAPAIMPGEPAARVGRWSSLPPGPLEARHEAVGGWLDGRFLVVGGWSAEPCPAGADCMTEGSPRRDGAAFDPATGTWQRLPDAPGPVLGSAVVLGSTLYVVTTDLGLDDAPVSFFGYDARREAWSTLAPPRFPFAQLVATDRAILAIATTDEVGPARDLGYDPERRTWTELPDDPLGPSYDRAALWLGDRLLLGAHDLVRSPGSEQPSLVRLAELDPARGSWTTLPATEILGGRAVWASERVVWTSTGSADGGGVNGWGRSYPYGGILDPTGRRWSSLPAPPGPQGYPGLCLTVDGLAAVGGHLLDPVRRTWTRVPDPPGSDRTAETVIAGDGMIFAWGGYTEGDRDNLATGHLLRLR